MVLDKKFKNWPFPTVWTVQQSTESECIESWEAVKLSAWPWSFLVSFYGLSTHQSIGRKDIKISVNV